MTAPAHSELGASSDPNSLVPGNAETVHRNAQVFATEATKCSEIGAALKAVRVPSWTGPSADGFETRMTVEPTLWADLSDSFDRAARALSHHGSTLTTAQGLAADAIAKWAEGERVTQTAVATYNQQVEAYNRSCAVPSSTAGPSMGPARPGAFSDPGQRLRDEAERLLKQARESVETSGESAMVALGRMPGAATSTSSSGPSASGSVEGPQLRWGSDSSYGTDPTKGRDGRYDDGVPDGGPFSLSLLKLEAKAHVWQGTAEAEDYWGGAKVHAKGEVTVLGAEADAGAVIDRNGVNVNLNGEAYLAKVHGEAGGEWGYAEAKVDGTATVGADAKGDLVLTRTAAHAGGDLFAGGRAEINGSGDIGGVGGSGKAEAWAGVGIGGDADIGYHDGTFTLGGSGGVALGVGGKIGGKIEIDIPEVVHTVGTAARSIDSLF